MLDGHYGYVAGTRVFSGLGEGVVGGICYAAMGRSARPERSISIYFAGQAIVGMVGLGSFGWIAASLGWPWLFLILSAIALPGFWLAASIGRARSEERGVGKECVSTCRYRWSTYHSKKNKNKIKITQNINNKIAIYFTKHK